MHSYVAIIFFLANSCMIYQFVQVFNTLAFLQQPPYHIPINVFHGKPKLCSIGLKIGYKINFSFCLDSMIRLNCSPHRKKINSFKIISAICDHECKFLIRKWKRFQLQSIWFDCTSNLQLAAYMLYCREYHFKTHRFSVPNITKFVKNDKTFTWHVQKTLKQLPVIY